MTKPANAEGMGRTLGLELEPPPNVMAMILTQKKMIQYANCFWQRVVEEELAQLTVRLLVQQIIARPKKLQSPTSLQPRKNASFQDAYQTMACCHIPKIFTGMTELIHANQSRTPKEMSRIIHVLQSRLGPLTLMIQVVDRAIRATPKTTPQQDTRLIPQNFNQ